MARPDLGSQDLTHLTVRVPVLDKKMAEKILLNIQDKVAKQRNKNVA